MATIGTHIELNVNTIFSKAVDAKLRKVRRAASPCKLGKANPPILHELMRHSSMQITMDFYASVDDALQDAIKTLT